MQKTRIEQEMRELELKIHRIIAPNLTIKDDASLKLKGISLACGMYDLKEALHSGTDSALVYLGDFDSKDEQMLDVLGAVNSDYPPSFIFSCPNDFLFAKF